MSIEEAVISHLAGGVQPNDEPVCVLGDKGSPAVDDSVSADASADAADCALSPSKGDSPISTTQPSRPKRKSAISIPLIIPPPTRVRTAWKSKVTCMWANRPLSWGDAIFIQTSHKLATGARHNITVELADGTRLLAGRPKVIREPENGLVFSMDGFDEASQQVLEEIRAVRSEDAVADDSYGEQVYCSNAQSVVHVEESSNDHPTPVVENRPATGRASQELLTLANAGDRENPEARQSQHRQPTQGDGAVLPPAIDQSNSWPMVGFSGQLLTPATHSQSLSIGVALRNRRLRKVGAFVAGFIVTLVVSQLSSGTLF